MSVCRLLLEIFAPVPSPPAHLDRHRPWEGGTRERIKDFFFSGNNSSSEVFCVCGVAGGEDPLEVVLHSGHLSPLPRCHQGLIRTLGMSKRVSPGQARRLHSLRYAMQSYSMPELVTSVSMNLCSYI